MLDRLKNTDGVTVEVAHTNAARCTSSPAPPRSPCRPRWPSSIAADPEEQRVFLGENGRAPLARPWFADLPPSAPTVERCKPTAPATPGALLFDLWQLHREELLRLLDTDRRVALAWHRGAAPLSPSSCCGMPAHPDRAAAGHPLRRAPDGRPRPAAQRCSRRARRTALPRATSPARPESCSPISAAARTRRSLALGA